MSPSPVPIFDGHNDTLLRLYRKGLSVSSFFERGADGHLDLPRAHEGGFAGGLFACFVPSDTPDEDLPAPDRGGYAVPFPGTPSRERALTVTTALVARLQRLERASGGSVSVCRTVPEIDRLDVDRNTGVSVVSVNRKPGTSEQGDRVRALFVPEPQPASKPAPP